MRRRGEAKCCVNAQGLVGTSTMPQLASATAVDVAGRLRGKRILFVLPSLDYGGAERQAVHLSRYLATREGAEVTLVGLKPHGRASEICAGVGIPYCFFPMRHKYRSRFGQVRDVLRFIRFIRLQRAEVLLPYCMFQNVLCGLTWRLGGARVCIWNQRDEGRSRLEPWVERVAVRQTRCFVSNSQHGATFLAETLGVPDRLVHLVHNGVDLPPGESAPVERRVRAVVPPGAFVACMVANIHGFKDHLTLVKSWREVANRLATTGRDAHLLLAGERGDRYDAVLEEVRRLDLSSRIHFLGPVRDVQGVLAASDIAVFSSNAEGLPNAVLEAMAVGLPVVATDYPGIRESVGQQGAHLLVRPHDPKALADKIVGLACDPNSRAVGLQGQSRVRREFSIEKMGEHMVWLILDQLAGSR